MADEQFYGALLNLGGGSLLLPNLAIAEVQALNIRAPESGLPDWWLGQVEHDGQRLPLISFMRLNGGDPVAVESRARVAIINSYGSHLDAAQFAIHCEGYPHLVALNRAAVSAVDLRDSDVEEFVLGRVRIANNQAVIPDLEAIEAALVRAEAALQVTA